MDKRIVLTIGRQFGSGGREIGKKLAEELNISYYDKELIAVAARESGLCQEVFENVDEKSVSGLTHAFSQGLAYMGMYTPYVDILSNEGLFKIQSDAIRKLAETESCVIIGRCADYILRDNPNCLSFFVHNKMDNRVHRVMNRQEVTVEQAEELIIKTDKTRASYYNYYTNKQWGMSSSYNFSIDVSVLGIDKTVQCLKNIVEEKLRSI